VMEWWREIGQEKRDDVQILIEVDLVSVDR
jgi:hypothetical protein